MISRKRFTFRPSCTFLVSDIAIDFVSDKYSTSNQAKIEIPDEKRRPDLTSILEVFYKIYLYNQSSPSSYPFSPIRPLTEINVCNATETITSASPA